MVLQLAPEEGNLNGQAIRRIWWFGWRRTRSDGGELWKMMGSCFLVVGFWKMMWSHEGLQSGEGCVKKNCWENRFAAESLPLVIQRSLRIVLAKCSSCKNPDFRVQHKGISIFIDFFRICIDLFIYLSVDWSIGSGSRLAANTCADTQPQDNVGWILRRSCRNLSLTVPFGDVVEDWTVSEVGDVFFLA